MSEYAAVARRFVEKFGFGPVGIDAFDMFIIDNNLAIDPETDDTSDIRHQSFIRDRAQARKRLDAGAKALPANAFSIRVLQAGKTYSVDPLADGQVMAAKAAIDRVDVFSSNKVEGIQKMKNQVAKMYAENPDDLELRESVLMLDIIQMQADSLGKNFKAQIAQFNTALLAVEQKVEASVQAALEKAETGEV